MTGEAIAMLLVDQEHLPEDEARRLFDELCERGERFASPFDRAGVGAKFRIRELRPMAADAAPRRAEGESVRAPGPRDVVKFKN